MDLHSLAVFLYSNKSWPITGFLVSLALLAAAVKFVEDNSTKTTVRCLLGAGFLLLFFSLWLFSIYAFTPLIDPSVIPKKVYNPYREGHRRFDALASFFLDAQSSTIAIIFGVISVVIFAGIIVIRKEYKRRLRLSRSLFIPKTDISRKGF